MLETAWAWITETTDLPTALTMTAVAAGVATGIAGRRVRSLRLIATWFHESGHALMAIILGRSVTGIVINANGSGVTESLGRRSRLEQSLVAFSGYPAPAVSGAIILGLALEGRINLATILTLTIMAGMLLLQRSLLGCAISLALIAAAVSLIFAPTAVSLVILGVLAGYLLSASPITILELRYARRHQLNVSQHSDADTLAHHLLLPAPAWEGLFLATSLAAPLIAAWAAFA